MPWIFLSLMLVNAVYFGWQFMLDTKPQGRPTVIEQVQVGAPILLLKERPASAQSLALPAPVLPDAPEVLGAVGAPQCYALGPFMAAEVLERVSERMRAKGFLVRNDKRKSEGHDYWVFIPAFVNHDKAEARLAELRARGVESFIVNEGVFINSISLGHFSRAELAQAFKAKLQVAGIVAEYREIAKPGVEQWLSLAPVPGRVKPVLRTAVEAELVKNTALKRENVACNE